MSRIFKKKHGRRLAPMSEKLGLRRFTGLRRSSRNLADIGLTLVKLSTLAQRAVNCVIGVDLDLENPWTYVQKEKIEDNLDLHSESSEFLPIANKIHSYPDTDFLMCLKGVADEPHSRDAFLICLTIEEKERVLNLLENDHLIINNCVKNLLERKPRAWNTFGSEIEIWEETLDKIRPLFAVDIECEFPIFKGMRKFSLSLAYPDNRRFVEFITEKRNSELVFKRRMTISIQVSPRVNDAFNQTIQVCQMNQVTQTIHKYNVMDLSAHKCKQLLYFLKNTMKILSENILLNANINLFCNDYELLASKHINKMFHKQTPLKYFRDVNYSRRKYVSALVWHPKISGLVAVAYTHETLNLTCKENPKFKRLEFLENVVLIWCYSFCVHPKLILHSHREIVSLCFCPYNINILIGGCANGQLIIWDLTNKLEQVEKNEILLTPKEQEYREIIESYTNWMLLSEDVAHVKPTAISDILASHHSAVTSISWMSSNFECTKNGNIVKTIESDKPFMGGQFITCSLDGLIYFWDLEKTRRMIINKVKTRKQSLSIFKSVSPFQKLNHTLIPVFKLIVESPFPFLSLTNLLINDQKFMYKAINPETANDTFKRTYFKAIKSDYPKKFPNQFTAVTNIGTMFTFTWNGYDYDQGNLINYATAENVTFVNWVHDTPIHTCAINPNDNHILLTIGGKIFAIWNCKLDSKALMWRKNNVRYNSGLWSVNNNGLIIMFRVDSKIELWDVLSDSKSASRIIEFAGMQILDSFLDWRSYHVTKETYFKADDRGNMVLTSLMSKEQDRKTDSKYNSTLFLEFGKRIVERRQGLQQFLNDWKEKHAEPSVLLDISEHSLLNVESVVDQNKKTPISAAEKWKKMEYEKKLLNLIVGNYKLDPIEVERNKHMVMKETEEKAKVQNKIKHKIKCKMQIFESEKKTLFERKTAEMRKRESLSYYGKNPVIYKEIKKMYMRNYYEIEKDILKKVQVSSCKKIFLPNLIEKRRLTNKKSICGDGEIQKFAHTYSFD